MKRILILIWTAILLLSGCSVFRGKVEGEADTPLIPSVEDPLGDTHFFTLYFGFQREEMLMSEYREIESPLDQQLERTALQALIDGPSSDEYALTALIPPETQIKAMSSMGSTLLVTFSSEFLALPASFPNDWRDNDSLVNQLNLQRRLCAYAIANTIIELGRYSRVQLLVDQDNSGVGQRITRGVMGFVGDGKETNQLEPLERKASLIMSPVSALMRFMDALAYKDWTTASDCITSGRITARPKSNDIEGMFFNHPGVVTGFVIADPILSQDQTSAVVSLSFSERGNDGTIATFNNVPILLYRQRDGWKVSWDSVLAYFLEREG